MLSKTSQLLLSASNPCAHAWVSANAGAGKTSLLVMRVLRLLLTGVRPASVLCLTYTKAAASEMRERIDKQLGAWAVAGQATLEESLHQICGEAPSKTMLDRARTLLAEVLDEPEGIRIQTIHAFCQSLLQRFPLEAGMPPHFTVMDERTSEELLREAATRLLAIDNRKRDAQVKAAIRALASRFSDKGFEEVLRLIQKQKRRFHTLFLQVTDIDILCRIIIEQMGFTAATMNEQSVIAQHYAYDDSTLEQLRQLARELSQSSKKEGQTLAPALAHWLETTDSEQRVQRWDDYQRSLLTIEREPRKFSNISKALPSPFFEALQHEQQRAIACHASMDRLATCRSSVNLVELAQALLTLYDTLKSQQGLLDYDDLITFSTRLLTDNNNENASWVLYKLDGGIDHILVDEAQDTSLEQWQIVRALTDEFFAGEGRSQKFRSLFVVGDEKQSIYRFQGAEPRAFIEMHNAYQKRASEAGQAFVSHAMNASRRSTQAVLNAVDLVFSTPSLRRAVMALHGEVRHDLVRAGQAGRVELWPLHPLHEKEEKQVWELPLEPRYRQESPQQLAEHIAGTIEDWLKNARPILSLGRAIRPDDILLLVQRRKPMMPLLVRALKRRHIPVMGASDDPLPQNLAAMDMLALAKFLLLPEDDLNLAALLKSPLYDISEEELLQLAQREAGCSLWQNLHLCAEKKQSFSAAREELSHLLSKADFMPPFELFSFLLNTLGGIPRMCGRMGHEYRDALNDFLTETLAFENTHTPTLQGFVHWLERSNSKRAKTASSGAGYVRIMTVHGAKGLEAPVVFLADSNALQNSRQQVEPQWYDTSGGVPLPVWPRSSKSSDPISKALYGRKKLDDEDEHKRLLYVAMTRARDELYICGVERNRNESGASWYQLINEAMQQGAQPCETPLGKGLCLTCEQTAEPASDTHAIEASEHVDLPAWLHSPAPQEPRPSKPLSPSRLAEPEDEAPLQSPVRDGAVFRRGLLIHRLLQYLPSLPASQRTDAAALFMQHQATMFSEAEHAAIIRESLAVIEFPEYAPFFAEGSLAEVPLSGVIELRDQPYTVAGQVDRLCIGTHDIWVLDFKTNRVPPASLQQISSSYLRQMACYRELLQRIYPLHHIHCALLWTSVPKLSVLPASLLEEQIQHLDAA